MRRSSPLLSLVLLVSALASVAQALLPLPPPEAPPIGVNVHIVARTSAPAAEIADSRALIASVPRDTDLRDDGLVHEAIWVKDGPVDLSGIRQKIDILAPVGGKLVLNVTLIPWPGSPGWITTDTWGYVAESDFPVLAGKGAEYVAGVRAYWRSKGRKEEDLQFQIGNEMGAGHPGGFPGLARGEWSERLGRLYQAFLKKALFGRCGVIGPAVSFQDEPFAVAERERATYPAVYKLLRPYLDYSAVHSRTYAPWLSPAEYAKLNRSDAVTRAEAVAKATGLPCQVTENYVGTIDASDQGAALDALLALPPSPVRIYLYRYGEGDWLFSLPKGRVFPIGAVANSR